jgi:hypothetical protein
MTMTRRTFLHYAAGVMTVPWVARPYALRPRRSARAVLLDLPRSDHLSESAAGYEAALAELGPNFVRAAASSLPHCDLLVVPAAVRLSRPTRRAIVTCLEEGASVVVESGGGFATESDFRCHRAELRDALNVQVGTPVDVWTARRQGLPYVEYLWPIAVKVRDFSRVVPLVARRDEVIAWIDGLPVGLKRRVGFGTLIVLGSPLGPALWAGEVEARRLLSAVALPGAPAPGAASARQSRAAPAFH